MNDHQLEPMVSIRSEALRSHRLKAVVSSRMKVMRIPHEPGWLLERLERMHPDARIELGFSNPLELLVATILSAQCTDRKVNEVTASLFRKYRTAADYAGADPASFEQEIRPTGFYRAKARLILGAARMLVSDFGGSVPRTMGELVRLPGVARKTGNIILSGGFGLSEGMAVDTHVGRVARRLGLSAEEDPVKVERDLLAFFPNEKWSRATELMVFLGRFTCRAKDPDCPRCLLNGDCPSSLPRGRPAGKGAVGKGAGRGREAARARTRAKAGPGASRGRPLRD